MNPFETSGHFKSTALLLVTVLFLASSSLVPAVQTRSASAQTTSAIDARAAMERGNAQRTGVYHTSASSPAGEAAWQSQRIFEMKRGKTDFGSTAYVTDRSGTFRFVGADMFWAYAGVGYSDPIVADGVLYFSVYIGDAHLYAVDARTGELKWRATREKGMYSAPSVAGETLYLGADSGLFLAVDLKNNQEKWHHTRSDQSRVLASPAIVDGFVYYVSTNGTLYALEAATGALKWTHEIAGHYFSAPAVAEGVVYLTSLPFLYALDSKSGAEKWKLRLSEGGRTPAVANGLVYYVDYEGHIRTVDAGTGQPQPKPRKDHQTAARIVIDGQTIYFTGRNTGKLFAIDALTRETKWEFSVAMDVRCNAPIAAAERLYFTCSDGRLYAVDAKTGKKAWTSHSRTFPLSTPVLAGGMVYFISDDGKVYAIK